MPFIPRHLVSPASREFHGKHLDAARRSGFVYVRHHTHCELPEFYEAADEAGILVQPGLPYYGNHTTEKFSFEPKRALAELIDHYRRYVSLATYCMGNEGHLGSPLDRDLYQMVKTRNPDRLVLHQDGGRNTPENSDFRSGPMKPWKPGSFTSDVPYIAHEYLNLGVKFDPRIGAAIHGTDVSSAGLEELRGFAAAGRTEPGLGRRLFGRRPCVAALLSETGNRVGPLRSHLRRLRLLDHRRCPLPARR